MMEDLSFIPDIPSGPLDAYRARASFDWKRLKLSLEGDIELLKLKYKIWSILEKDPLFAHSRVTPSSEEQKRITQLQVKRINEYKFLTKEAFRSSYSKRTRTLMTINEAVQSLNPSVSVKMAIGIYLVCNALLSLGTERHLKFYEKTILDREILASMALTEIAHGSDAKLMRTTATYDARTREFVLHTPDFEAAKCWVGNLGRTCTHTIAFAQLITPDGTNHGLHGFIVPVRDPGTLETYPGLIVGDMGEKIGVHGIDNGFILFNQYRIPRENLLNRTADVTEEGVYESSFSDPSRILGAALENLSAVSFFSRLNRFSCGIRYWFILFNQYRIPRNLLNRTADVTEEGVYESSFSDPSRILGALENLSAGRVGIMQESCQSIASAVAIAVRYAAARKQFGEPGNEIALIEYQLHQWRLFGYLAAAVVFRVYIRSFTQVYLGYVEKSNTGVRVDNLSEAVAEIHAMVSCSKPLLTWTVLDAAQQCREACGGHGFFKSANLGDIRSNHEPTVTYEGDNNVLSQQAGNWLLRQYEAALAGSAVDSPIGTVTFLSDYKRILELKFDCTETKQLKSPEFIINTYKWLICWLLRQTHDKYLAEQARGLTKFEARSRAQVYRWKSLTRVYAEYLAVSFALEDIREKEPALRPVYYDLFYMYGLWSLDKHLVEMYQGGYASGEAPSRLVRSAILELCDALRGPALGVADALAPPDFVLNSVLARADGKLYQNIEHYLYSTPGNLGRASWWRQIVGKTPAKL